jgi:hypothetical protein
MRQEATGKPLPGDLPTPVVNRLAAEGGKPGDILLAAQSDLSPEGQFGEQWLLIDRTDLWVISRRNGTADLRYRFSLGQIEDAKIERCVGNGLLQLTVNQQPHVLLHYSNELTDRFGRVAHYYAQRPFGGVGLGRIYTPVAVGVLASEQLFHQRQLRNRRPGFAHLWVVGGPLKNVRQHPVTHRWVLHIQQPPCWIDFELALPACHPRPL